MEFTAQPDPNDRLLQLAHIRRALEGLFAIERYSWQADDVLVLSGKLMQDAELIYPQIRKQMEGFGFTPFLTRSEDGQFDELRSLPIVIKPQVPAWKLPLILFIVTLICVVLTGALYHWEGTTISGFFSDIVTKPSVLIGGLPFAGTLLGILVAHEMGHYVVGRWRKSPASLPYFIPMPPFISFTGTMGAVIVQREPMQDRKRILEIGIAGPIAGLVVAIPLLFYGLSISSVGPVPAEYLAQGYIQEGNSLLYAGIKYLVFGQRLPYNGVDVQLSSVAWGAWIGLLVTMINMLPVGQLDGGHVAYSLLGKNAVYLAYLVIAVCIAMGFMFPQNYVWFVWAGMAFLIGVKHPAPLNDVTRLGPKHIALAIFGLLLFCVLFMPVPLLQIDPS
jgi:membrane-associated protease RseP (regulator of RpoE activity)